MATELYRTRVSDDPNVIPLAASRPPLLAFLNCVIRSDALSAIVALVFLLLLLYVMHPPRRSHDLTSPVALLYERVRRHSYPILSSLTRAAMIPPGTRLIPLLALSLLALTACSSTQSVSTSEERSYASSSSSDDTGTIEPELRAEARRWEGVPHRLGGTDRRGIDCSALTQVLYADVLGLDLPRETRRQSRVGSRVQQSDLQPGDLVFFRPGRKQRHVGIYLSNGEFVHASSSTGVTVSSLHTDYWQRTWWQARRVLPENTRVERNPETRSVSSTDDSRRSGW